MSTLRKMSFIEELKRRNVFRVGIAYAVSAWVLLQVVDIVLENVAAPPWVMQIFMLALAIGFPIALLFAWAFEMTPEGVKLERDVDRSQSITQKTGQKMNRGIIIALTIAVTLLLVDRFRQAPDTDPQVEASTTENAEPAAVAIETPEKSIAVLPFVNMSSDPEQDYFADGISEEILNALAQVTDLKVAGRTSSFSFKGKDKDLLSIGKVLHVNHILEGSVRKSGSRIRITAQLIKVDDGFHMWSETYDRELTDIFVIQDEISAAILSQLKTQLLGEQQLVTTQTNTRSYELYLLAKQRIYERNQPSLEMAIKLVNEAIEIDNTYSPAYAQLGIATILVSERIYGSLPHAVSGKQAKLAVDKALQLDPDNAEALAGLGLYFRAFELDGQKAMKVLKQALAINPNLTNANTWLATELTRNGELKAAMQLVERTFERDPLHGPTYGNLSLGYSTMGDNDKAREMLESLFAYLPDDAGLLSSTAQVSFFTGQLADATTTFQKTYEKESHNTVSNIWYGLALRSSRHYEQMANIAPDVLATLALSRLDREEEALIMGSKAVSGGRNPDFYFQALIENERYTELTRVLESLWMNLDDFSATWSGRRGWGYNAMGFIAQAYREQGNEELFRDAMMRFKAALDKQHEQGADNWLNSFSNAYFAMLAGDNDAAIGFLEKSFQQGGYLDTENKTAWPIFRALDGDHRYEAAKAAMNAHLKEELWKMENET